MPKNTTKRKNGHLNLPYSQLAKKVAERASYGNAYNRFARMQEALGEPGAALPGPSSKAARNKAIVNRLKKEFYERNTTASRRQHLKNVLKRNYKTDLVEPDVLAPVLAKYLDDASEEEVREMLTPFAESRAAVGEAREKLRRVVYAALSEIEKKEQTAAVKEDRAEVMKLMKIVNPMGLPAGYGSYKGGGVTTVEFVDLIHKYTGKPKDEIREALSPRTPRGERTKMETARHLLKEAIDGWEASPDGKEKNADEKRMKEAARLAIPTGVVGYGGAKRMLGDDNAMNSKHGGGGAGKRTTRRRQGGGGCGCEIPRV